MTGATTGVTSGATTGATTGRGRMRLIGSYHSPFVRRVGVTLHLHGFGYTQTPFATDTDAAAIRAFNPLGRVPALVLDDGEVLIDSSMIADYLDQLVGPRRALTPPEGPTRRQVNRLVALALGATEKYVAAYYERHARPEALVSPEWLRRLELQVHDGLAALDGMVGTPWCVGAALTQADICVTVALWAMRFDMPHLAPPGRFPGLDAIAAEAERLGAFGATRPR